VSSDWPVAVVLGAGVGSTRDGGETLVLGGAVGAAVGAPVGLGDFVAGVLDAAPADDAAPPEGAPPVCANACAANTDRGSANHIVRMCASQCFDFAFLFGERTVGVPVPCRFEGAGVWPRRAASTRSRTKESRKLPPLVIWDCKRIARAIFAGKLHPSRQILGIVRLCKNSRKTVAEPELAPQASPQYACNARERTLVSAITQRTGLSGSGVPLSRRSLASYLEIVLEAHVAEAKRKESEIR
jgi:hypothetical protein